ncbi:MAG: putative metal-binding motif-containing protein [Sandaracinaceae bacterium]
MVDDPCAPGEVCDEAMDRCATETCGPDPDADGDGVDSIACGGIDCDDDDEFRFPGNAEVCDAMGHDEDCTDETVAGATDGDLDEDGFTSALCCNGANCGDDCDDDDRSVFPGARELCNGRDDDCDGMTDEEPPGADPLCPGGTCSAGRCDLRGWDRTFGGTGGDFVAAVAMDQRGRVYITGWFEGTARFGGDPHTSAGSIDIFVAAFEADGAYRWSTTFGGAMGDAVTDIAYDPVADQLYLATTSYGAIDFGGGSVGGPSGASFVVALQTDGTYLWHAQLPLYLFVGLDGHDGVVVNTAFDDPFDFGGGSRSPVGQDTAVVRWSSDGRYLWDAHIPAAPGGYVRPARIALDSDGSVSVAGEYRGGPVDFGGGPRPNAGRQDVFALRLDGTGIHIWDYTAGGSGEDFASALAVGPAGQGFVVGSFQGTVDFGLGPETSPDATRAFLVALDSAGRPFDAQTWGGMGLENVARAVAQDSRGFVHVVGSFAGAVDFGGGGRSAPTEGAGFHVIFDGSLNHFSDRMITYAGHPIPCSGNCSVSVTDIAIGPADSTALIGGFASTVDLGGGARTSAGSADGFVHRVPN